MGFTVQILECGEAYCTLPPAHVPHSPCPSLFLLLLFYLNSDLLSVQVMVAVLPFPNKKKLTNSKQKTQHSCSRV